MPDKKPAPNGPKGKRGAPRGNQNAIGNPGGGRPTKFEPRFGQMIIDWFNMEPYRKELKSKGTGYGKTGNVNYEREEFQLIANKLPTLVRFCMKIGVHYVTLENWVNQGQEKIDEDKPLTKENAKNPDLFEFYLCFKTAKELYKEFIVQNGLSGLSPSPFAMFVLTNTTDMRMKQDIDVTSGGEKLGDIVTPRKNAALPPPDDQNV